MLACTRMNKSTRKRLQLRPLTVRILEVDPSRLIAGILTTSTEQPACSGTCTCTDPTVCKPCHA